MTQEELKTYIGEMEPNICQISVLKDGKRSIPANGTGT